MHIYIDPTFLVWVVCIAMAVFFAIQVADLLEEIFDARDAGEDESEIAEWLDEFDAEWAPAEADGLI